MSDSTASYLVIIRQYIQDQEQHQQNEDQDELNVT